MYVEAATPLIVDEVARVAWHGKLAELVAAIGQRLGLRLSKALVVERDGGREGSRLDQRAVDDGRMLGRTRAVTLTEPHAHDDARKGASALGSVSAILQVDLAHTHAAAGNRIVEGLLEGLYSSCVSSGERDALRVAAFEIAAICSEFA